MYKAIIFDFFDVIRTDAYKSWLKLHDYKLEGAFLEVVEKQDRSEINTDKFLATLSELTGQAAKEIFEEMEAGATIGFDVLALIDELRPNYKIGLLSNAPKGFLRNLLQENDLEKYFHHIVISSEVGMIKPEAEIFNHILEKMNIRPHEALFIDDSQKNIDGASKVGIDGILFTNIEDLKKKLKTKLEV
jgi:HAD superfamily hydrolase (TIGR01509 family)